jgi:hypothetical protein
MGDKKSAFAVGRSSSPRCSDGLFPGRGSSGSLQFAPFVVPIVNYPDSSPSLGSLSLPSGWAFDQTAVSSWSGRRTLPTRCDRHDTDLLPLKRTF